MKVTVLVENSTISNKFRKKHGLSLYIESIDDSILFDLGPNKLYRKNAKKLDVDLDKINHVVISHGHIDHIGGLKYLPATFKTYLYEETFNPLYASLKFGLRIKLSLDNKYKSGKNVILTNGLFRISDRLQLFSDVFDLCNSNKQDYLMIVRDGKLLVDEFYHEQNLLIHENNKHFLVVGCAHKGILNIINKAEELIGNELDYVFGGFHLKNPLLGRTDNQKDIIALAEKLKTKKTIYYTGHCTGEKAYKMLKSVLGQQLHPLSTGKVIEL